MVSVVISSVVFCIFSKGIFPYFLHMKELELPFSYFMANECMCFVITVIIGIFSDNRSISTKSNQNQVVDINEKLSFSLLEKCSGEIKYPICFGIKKMFQDRNGIFTMGIPIMFILILFIRLSYYAEETWLIGNWRSGWNCDYIVSVVDTKNSISNEFSYELEKIRGISYYSQWEIPTYTKKMKRLSYIECKIEKEKVTDIGEKQLSLSSNIEKEDDNKHYYIATNFFGYEEKGLKKMKRYLVEGKIVSDE